MTPTWYDLLGVEPDASADEIRAAWKAAIADLDPGDRRFRALNEAAEVLLDADRRAAYDASAGPPSPQTRSRRGRGGDRRRDWRRLTRRSREQDPRTAAATYRPRLAARRPCRSLVAALLACAGYLVTQPSDDADRRPRPATPRRAAERAATRSCPTTTATSTTTRRPPAR